jgi:hypothetical protein
MAKKTKTPRKHEKLFLCLPCNILLFTETYFMEDPCPKCGGYDFRQMWPWRGVLGSFHPSKIQGDI